MKLSFKFIDGTEANGWDNYTPEQVQQVIDAVSKGYEFHLNHDTEDPKVFKAGLIDYIKVIL